MKKKIFGIFSHTTLIALEILAVVLGLLFLTAGVLIWRLTSGPIDVGFAKGYIEQALYDPVNGYSASLQDVVVAWPDLGGPLVLELDEVGLFRDGRSMVSVENVNLGLSLRHLLIGQVKPTSIVLTAPSVQLIRTVDNDIRFSLETEAKEAEAAASDEDDPGPLMTLLESLAKPDEAVDKRSPVEQLQSVEIRQARMVVEDHRLGITWYLHPLNLNFSRDDQGLIVSASAELPGGRDRASRIQADIVYARNSKDLLANIHVQDFDPHVLSRKIESLSWLNDHYAILNGNIELAFGAELDISRAAVSLSSRNGEIAVDGVYDAPLAFEELFLDAAYNKAQGLVDIKQLSFKTGGVEVGISAPVTFSDTAVNAPVTIQIPMLEQAQISPLWPDSLRGDGAEIWLTQKLSQGRFTNTKVDFVIDAAGQGDTWEVDVNHIVAGFGIEDMSIDYRAPLAPIKQAKGTGRFENDALTINIESGKLTDVDVLQGKAVIDNIIAGDGHANINMSLSGPLQSVFRYIEPEPIGISEEELGLNISAVKGRAKLDVAVSFPTVRDLLAEQVKVKVDGTLSDVLLPDVIKTIDLSGGPMKLTVADGAASLKGKGMLEGRPVDFSWKEYVAPEGKPFVSQITAKLSADAKLRELMGIGLTDWIDGTFPVDVTYTELASGRSEVQVNTDLTPGKLMIGPFDYVKAPGVPGSASTKILLRNGFVQEVQDLLVETDRLRMSGGRFLFNVVKGEAVLARGNVPRFILDENDLKFEFEIGQSGLLKMAVDGAFLDARPFLSDEDKGDAPYDGPPMIISGAVDRMRTHPARMIDKVKLYLDMAKTGDVKQFEMDAVAGKGDIYLRVKPNNKGVMSVRLEADDAGAAMRAFDMYENVKGGKLVLYGEAASISKPKILYGNAELTDFYVVNAPVLARLISAISLAGIQQLLGNEGIYFSRLESQFEWHINRMGDKYVAKNGRTSGSSLGLTFEGDIDKRIDKIDMEGTIVPVSMVNELIGSIPLIGDILTGGGGALIAATYSVEGPVKKPEVSVNPLSVLAPGILRKILFEGE